jgi:RNA ligase (TIGR02306 family)
MSDFKVPVTTIKEIYEHPNAHSLEIAKIYDFRIVIQKGKYKIGDTVIYCPIDSVLSQSLAELLFPPDSKIKLNKNRIKQIKIRGFYSQGMIIDPELVQDKLSSWSGALEEDVSTALEITKYNPPEAQYQGSNTSVKKRDKPRENPFFHKFNGIDNFKWYPELFVKDELVSITEKIHGSNIRFGYVPYVANTLWRKIKKFFGYAPTYEWVYGSNNVQLQQRTGYKGYYGEDVYGKVLEKYDAKEKAKFGEIWYGELYGDGIQKNYNYGCTNGEHKLVVFDLKLQDGVDAKYVSPDVFRQLALSRGFEVVPELYKGPYVDSEWAKEFTKGDSKFVLSQKVIEGIVIKPLEEKDCVIGRKMLKLISEDYLSKEQSEFH